MQTGKCLNCEAELVASNQFCSNCGQKADTHRLNLGHIGHELIHSFFLTYKGFFSLAWEMIYRPGHIAREYVEGKRKKYFSPFSFLVIIVAVSTFFVANWDLMLIDVKKVNPVSKFISQHFNLIIFCTVPLIALFSWLLFKRQGKNYAEHLTLAAFVSGERSLFFTLIVVPLWIFARDHYFVVLYSYLAVFFIYYAWASMQFNRKYTVWAFIKGILVSVIVQGIVSMVIISCILIYYKFFYKR